MKIIYINDKTNEIISDETALTKYDVTHTETDPTIDTKKIWVIPKE